VETRKKERIFIYEKRKTAFIGVDMHKDIHVAVVIDCWTNILGEITFPNRPSKFDKFMQDVKKIYKDLTPCFGLEDTRGFGRNFASYLLGHKFTVKHVNPAYTDSMRSSAPMSKKNDSFDAFCVAKVLRDMVDTLPDEEHNDLHWTIRQLVKRRNSLVKGIVIAKNQLNSNLTNVYPSYKKYFCDVDNKTALLFWEKYPHPQYLKGVKPETLLEELRAIHKGMKQEQAEMILTLSEQNSPKEKEFQTERDLIIKSLVREIRFKKQENEDIDNELKRLVDLTGYKLQTMPGINLITAANIISEIGNIERFPNSDKLAQFCGVCPVNFSSAGKGKDQRSRQGNRVLNAIFHFLAIQLVQISPSGKPRHPVFREYFERKVKEGKTKPQALVCVSRRAVRIIYGMMKSKTEYKPFEKAQEVTEIQE